MKRKIDFSDIPELSDKQLKSMKRPGRPPIGFYPKEMIAIRLDPTLLKRIKLIAQKQDKGYQTLISEILASYISKKSA